MAIELYRVLTLHSVKLVSVTTAHPDVPNPTLLNHVMQRLHRFFDRGVIIESMTLKHVDIVELQAGKGSLNRVKDVLFRFSE